MKEGKRSLRMWESIVRQPGADVPTPSGTTSSAGDLPEFTLVPTKPLVELTKLTQEWEGKKTISKGDRAQLVGVATVLMDASRVQDQVSPWSTLLADISDIVRTVVQHELAGRPPTPTTQASTGKTPPTFQQWPAPQVHPSVATRPQRPQTPEELTVRISMRKAGSKSPAQSRTPIELKSLLDGHLSKVTIEGLRGTTVHSVHKMANGDLAIQAQTEAQAVLLLAHADSWIKQLEDKAELKRDLITLQIDHVPIASFDPSSTGAIQLLYNSNSGVFNSPTDVVEVRWLKPVSRLRVWRLHRNST
ncbi:hypothetical protein PQX77_022117 [Marasmius sp. AFHP31]|nr:hypothetical protein PQX77_022117 [Marasmius sp. AFHP31]